MNKEPSLSERIFDLYLHAPPWVMPTIVVFLLFIAIVTNGDRQVPQARNNNHSVHTLRNILNAFD